MARRALAVLKNKWFLGGLLAMVALAVVGSQEIIYMTRQYTAGDVPWDSAPKEVDGRMVFHEHFSMHPGHYSFSQKLGIATKVDVMSMVRMDPDKRREGFAEFSTIRTQSPVGTLAPDFELESTDGGTIRLSDKRGRIAVFMFVAMTCPPARTQVDLWRVLHEKYDRNDVDIFFVYWRKRLSGIQRHRNDGRTHGVRQRAPRWRKRLSGIQRHRNDGRTHGVRQNDVDFGPQPVARSLPSRHCRIIGGSMYPSWWTPSTSVL